MSCLALFQRFLWARRACGGSAGLQTGFQPFRHNTHDTFAEDQHADDEHQPLNDQHQRTQIGQVVLHRHDYSRPDKRAKDGAHPADQGHQDNLAGHGPVGINQRGQMKHQRLGPARKPGQGRRDDEGHQLVALHLIPERDHPLFVLSDAF